MYGESRQSVLYAKKLPEPDWGLADCRKAIVEGYAGYDDWYPETHERLVHAKKICSTCPIKRACGTFGKANDLHGVWGGQPLRIRGPEPKQICEIHGTQRVPKVTGGMRC